MAAKVTVVTQTAMARELMTEVAGIRDMLTNIPSTYRKAAQAIDAANGGAATVQSVFGLGSAAEAQIVHDRLNAINAWIQGDSTPTGAEVLAMLKDLSDAFFIVTT